MDRRLGSIARHRLRRAAAGLRRRPWAASLVASLVAAVALVLVAIPSALATPPSGTPLNVFRLQGGTQPTTPPPGTGVDWADFHNNAVAFCASSGALNCFDTYTRIPDGVGNPADTSYFTGGGSKDRNDVAQWQWTGGDQAPDKNDIVNAFAATYRKSQETVNGQQVCQAGQTSCLVLFFGADRFATNGDAQMGFWFFQQPICLRGPVGTIPGDCPATTPLVPGTAGRFVNSLTGALAHHQDGDVLALVNFDNGGTLGLAAVYVWAGGPLGAPVPQLTPGSLECKTNADNPTKFCTSSNTADLLAGEPPWPYTAKDGGTSYDQSALIEGGINLGQLPGAGQCFPTFMAETRSSSGPGSGLSLDAQLKDFALKSLQSCGSGTETTPLQSPSGDPIPAGGLSIGTGSVQVMDRAVIDVSGTTSFGGTVTFFLCGPIAAPATCASGGTQIGTPQAVTGPSPVTRTSIPVTVTAANVAGERYCFRAEYSGDSAAGVPPSSDSRASECFTVNPVTPQLATQAGAGPVDFGQPVTDTATLAGTATRPTSPPFNTTGTVGAPANGTITFSLFGPDAVGSTTNCNTLAAGFATQFPNGIVVTVNGNGTYGPVSFTPQAPGVYHWKAVYSGDAPNTNGTSHNATCNDTGEDVVVRQIETRIATTPSAFPNDSATISSSVAGDILPAGGTVVFKLFGPTNGTTALANCQANSGTVGTGGLLYTQPFSVGGQNSVTVGTTNTSVAVNTDQTVYWRVTYAPGDTAHLGIQSACVENTVFDFTADAGPGSAFP